MPDTVIETVVEESPEETPVTPDFASQITTLNKRLSGKDAALTRTTQERDQLKVQADELRQWKLSQEQANMTEVQKLQQERDTAKADAQQARAEATSARMARDFPLAAEALGDNLSLVDPVRAAEIEARLKGNGVVETEAPAPRIDPNSPRRSTNIPPGKRTYEDLKAELATIPAEAWVSR